MRTKPKPKNQVRKALPILIIALLALYVLLPQLHSFNSSLKTIYNADFTYILMAVGFFVLTYFAATASYCFITYFRLPYWRTLLVQIADGFTNRLVPVGVGAVATNALYLSKQSKSNATASYIAILNNLIGFAAHIILLTVLLLVNRRSPQSLVNINLPKLTVLWDIALVVAAVCCVIFWRKLIKLSVKSYKTMAKTLVLTFKRPFRLALGLVAAMMVTIFYALTLYAVMLALNVHMSFLQAFLVLTVSVIALAVTPTPGGLGGVEAGLVACMVSFGVASSQALSVALVYRLITYWLPIAPGILGLELAVKRGYVARKLKL